MRFFFYGTLIDPDVRRVVLGSPMAAALHARDAVLDGWERRAVRGVSYPIILPRAGGRVDGVLASGLDAAAARRLADYEGPEYALTTVDVACADGRGRSARVFTPRPDGPLVATPMGWDYARWCARDKRDFLKSLDGA